MANFKMPDYSKIIENINKDWSYAYKFWTNYFNGS